MGHDFGAMCSTTSWPFGPCGAKGTGARRTPGKHFCRCGEPDCRCLSDRGEIADRELDDLVKRCLCRILDTLPPEMAEVRRRAEIDGQCTACIARCLGISPRTARSRLRAARTAVLDRLEPWARAYLESGYPSAKH